MAPDPSTADLSWDDFLTDRDKRVLEARSIGSPRRARGLGSKSALLLVDNYYYALGHERLPIEESIKMWPYSCGLEGWEAVDRSAELAAAARASGVPVIHVVHQFEDLSKPLGVRTAGREVAVAETIPEEMRAIPEDWLARANDIVDELAPEPGDFVMPKWAASSFLGTPLDFWLNDLDVDTVIVTGETTSGCVRATVVDAASRQLSVGIVEECCYDRTQGSHHLNLFDMDQKYGDVMSLADTIEYFKRG